MEAGRPASWHIWQGGIMTSKERMIHILLILQKETSNEQFLTTAEIVKRFTDMGIPTDRTTVKKDIDTMIACGIHILAERGTQMHYSYVDHTFELAELKMLIDAVGASKFITAERSEALIKKLNSMTSQKNAEELKRQLFNAGRVKTENKSTLYVVDAVYRAINERRKIEFNYYEYNVEKERVPRRGGEKYQLSPYAMLYNEDKYYLLGYSERMDKVITLRVDCMSVSISLEYSSLPGALKSLVRNLRNP
jgi:predicted DNA-binding transcriptional regulator YafY